MKKTLLIILMMAAVLSAAFAYEFSFTLIPKDGPLLKESVSDPYSFISKIEIQRALDKNQMPTKIRSAVEVYRGEEQLPTQYIDLPYNDDVVTEVEKHMTYLHMRMGASMSLLRCRFDLEDSFLKSIDAEVTLGGALNTVFNIFNSSASLGFDGTWMAGASVRFADKVVLRGGIHHFSGHYGDEILDDYYEYNQVDFTNKGKIGRDFDGKDPDCTYYLHNLMEYVRDNYWTIGTRIDVVDGLSVYGDLEWPIKSVWLRPFSSTPVGYKTQDGKELIEYVGHSSEGFTEEQVQEEIERKKNTNYKALRAHVGVEYFKEFSKELSWFVSSDVQMHQDGQTKHNVGTYSPDNPWELEFTLTGGIELGDFVPGKNIRFEITFHDGRVSTTDFFYQRMKYISIGMSLS